MTKEKIKKHESLATSITLERLNNLSRKSKRKFKLAIQDLKNEANEAMGTKVTILMPYKNI